MQRRREGTGCPDWNGSSLIELHLEPGWREHLWAALARFRYSGRRPLLNPPRPSQSSAGRRPCSAPAVFRGICSTLQTPDNPDQSRSGPTRPQDCDLLSTAYLTSMVCPSSQDIAALSQRSGQWTATAGCRRASIIPNLDRHCLSTPNSRTFSARWEPFLSHLSSGLRIRPEVVIWLPSRRDSWLTSPNSPGLFDLDQLRLGMEEGRTMIGRERGLLLERDSHDTTSHWLLTTTRPHTVRQDTGQKPTGESAHQGL